LVFKIPKSLTDISVETPVHDADLKEIKDPELKVCGFFYC
jgi:hypothetical protein